MDNKVQHQLDILQQESEAPANMAAGKVIIGTLISIDKQGQPLVEFEQNPTTQPIVAMTTLALNQTQSSRQVVLLFNQGDFNQPIIMGLIHSPLQAALENHQQDQDKDNEKQVELKANLDIDDVIVEGKKITFEAEDEMVFKCGESSITLTKDGKVQIRGKYILNRATGVNRIMGGSVQVN